MKSTNQDQTAEILNASCNDIDRSVEEIVAAIENGQEIPEAEMERTLGSIATILHVLKE